MNTPALKMSRLHRALLVAVSLGTLAAAPALAEPRLETVEECLETGTDLVSLPANAGGSLQARECATCTSLRLSFSKDTRYYIGDEAVSYTRLRATASHRGNTRLYVFYRPDNKTLTRVSLSAGQQ